MSETLQWGTTGEGFEPCGATVSHLQPGFYRPIMVPRGMGAAVVIQPIQLVTDNLLVLEDSSVQVVTEGIKKFWVNREKFKKHGITYKRSFLLEGPPGTGKTSIANIIAKFVVAHRGIVFYSEAAMFPATLQSIKNLRQIQNDPLMVVLEEFDQYMIKRGTLDALMQLLDGSASVDNIIVLATTNFIDKVDERFTKRPARIDEIHHVGEPSATARRSYLGTLLTEFGGNETEIDEYVTATEGLLLSHLRETVIATKILDQPLAATVIRMKTMIPTEKGSVSTKLIRCPNCDFPFPIGHSYEYCPACSQDLTD